jgi:hypothetical protein
MLYKARFPSRWGDRAIPPHYYVIIGKNIIGVRRDGIPTEWALEGGYWSPFVSAKIVKALEEELARIEHEEMVSGSPNNEEVEE